MRYDAMIPSAPKPPLRRAMPLLHSAGLVLRAAGLAGALCVLPTASPAGDRGESTTQVDARQITRLVEHALLAQLRRQPAAADASRIEVNVGALDSRLAFTGCAEPISVAADLDRLQARVNARVSCATPSPWAIYVPVELRVFRPVPIAARELQRGETVSEADIGEQERNVLAAGATTLVRRSEAVGQKVRRTIPAGSMLLATLLEQPVLVRRGDRINVDTVPGAISVRISAEALETARRGERVRVRNLQSGRVIDAVVTGDGTAQAL